jgi:hypothetical protein
LYHVIGLGFTNAPANTVLTLLAEYHKQYTGPLIDIEEYSYGVVHPVTKETITHYRKLIKDPWIFCGAKLPIGSNIVVDS